MQPRPPTSPARPAAPHPLFQRPWAELSWIVWVVYLVLPPLETLLIAPYERLSDMGYLGFELVCNGIGILCTGGTMHVLYAGVVPRALSRRLAPPQLILAHALVILLGNLVGAELAYPLELWRHGELDPVRYRLQHYRLGIVFATGVVLLLVVYDGLRARYLRARAAQAQSEQRARLAQLQALQIRTDPHFLFNVLNSIACLVELEPKKGVEALERLGGLFRNVLDSSLIDSVPLSAELAVVEDYLAIEAIRHERMGYRIEADAAARARLVPPLLLQPLVENAVKHGVARTRGPVMIQVAAQVHGDCLRIDVQDDACPEGEARPGAGKGLAIIAERLQLLYGAEATLQQQPRSPSGTTASVVLPLSGGRA